ncbi:MAG: LysR substrate-binding domain-containing protein [Pseudomonadota bacterium]
MPRRLPPLNALRAFEAAGRHGSFTGAAEELNVTHAAISRHIRGLEQRLGVQLFRTAPRGVALTEEGGSYLSAITPALDQIALATEDLTEAGDGLVTISCEPTFAVKWLMPRLGDFRARHPDIDIKLDATPRLANLHRYECDLAIRFFSGETDCFECDLISRTPVYPVGSPSLTKPENPCDLAQLGLLHEDKGALWCRWFTAAGCPDVVLRKSTAGLSTLLAVEGALAGQGLALLSGEMVTGDLEDGRLVRFSDIGLDYGGYYLVYLSETARRRPVRAFRTWLQSASEPLRQDSG